MKDDFKEGGKLGDVWGLGGGSGTRLGGKKKIAVPP